MLEGVPRSNGINPERVTGCSEGQLFGLGARSPSAPNAGKWVWVKTRGPPKWTVSLLASLENQKRVHQERGDEVALSS